jgi:hypothetical protein
MCARHIDRELQPAFAGSGRIDADQDVGDCHSPYCRRGRGTNVKRSVSSPVPARLAVLGPCAARRLSQLPAQLGLEHLAVIVVPPW